MGEARWADTSQLIGGADYIGFGAQCVGLCSLPPESLFICFCIVFAYVLLYFSLDPVVSVFALESMY